MRMTKRPSQLLLAVIGLALFSGALWALHRALAEYHYHEIVARLRPISGESLVAALALTILSYLDLTLYDTLACRYLRRPLPYRQTALVGFIGYAFSNNIGLANLAGGSIRYRFYTAWGFSPLEVARIVLFCGLTFWLGLCALGGVVFVVEPMTFPDLLHLPFRSVWPLGLASLLLVGGYGFLALVRKRPFVIRGWELPLPAARLAAGQIVVGVLDWALAGAVLYVLLPSEAKLSYPGFLGIFLLANVAGLISQVPGGLGVFETIVIVSLADKASPGAVFGSLIAFRGVYYLAPLCCAAALLGAHEMRARGREIRLVGATLGRWAPAVVPHVLAFSTFVSGAVLLFSGATPSAHGRLAILRRIVPLPVVETSHFLGSVAGVGLLLLARGLQRRLDAAYYLTIALLAGGIAFSLLKGLDFEEAVVLGVMLAAVLPCHRHFHRKASLLSQRFSAGWVMAILVVLLTSVWLGLFVHKHVDYTADLWWRFTLTGDAPRFLRASVGVMCTALFFGLVGLLRHAEYEAPAPGGGDLERAEPIVRESPQTYPYLALLGDKSLLFSEDGSAFLMFGVEGRSWVALKDPVGSEREYPELIWRFRMLADRHGGWPVFYQVGPDSLELYIDQGLTLLKIGEEAYVPLHGFSLEGGKHKDLRQACNRYQKQGSSFEVVESNGVAPLLSEIRGVSDAWLSSKNTEEKGFSLGFFDEDYLKRLPLAVVRRAGRVAAFANVLTGANSEELSIDLMRYVPEAADGAMDYLFAHLMLWGRERGYRRFCLGMTPLAGLDERPLAPMWNRLAGLVFRHGEHFYNFQGLRNYKEKFEPEWEPRYLASPGGLALPRMFLNIAALISGGVRGIVSK